MKLIKYNNINELGNFKYEKDSQSSSVDSVRRIAFFVTSGIFKLIYVIYDRFLRMKDVV